MAFGTPDGPALLEPRWWRFNVFNLSSFYGEDRFFVSPGYEVHVDTKDSHQLCHGRGEVKLIIQRN